MATVNLGRIKPVWKGAWSSSTQYIADDIVSYNNSAWIAVTTNTNSAPATNNVNWSLMALGTAIPTQTNNSGKVLTTDGSSLSWGLGLPSQTGNSGKVLTTDGTNSSWGESSGRLLGVQVLGPYASLSGNDEVRRADFRVGTSGTWTRPSGCNNVLVYVTGGGGGGQDEGDDTYRGIGGGGGGTAIKWISNVTSTVSYTVGDGGTGLYGSNGQAGNGTASSFGSYCTAFGGDGGSGTTYMAEGGGASGGDLNIPGGAARFNHSTGIDSMGGMSFWTQSGGRHRPSNDGRGTSGAAITGRWGAGGSNGTYDVDGISTGDVQNLSHGGAGVIVIYLYS
jgi:hypothetical protein